ncbi:MULTISPECIES: ATP-binding protein [Stenotrophomonas maltophilia group]|uniref:histidine kinase n=1 Tax=Stenotrophomonas maltophilia TaxID=40324 RepID=A0A246I8K2_STEMA|nr:MULTISPECIES: ATP-binding protein [Stenotrophomonas maltophilia group]MCO5736293.1 ATP-binding protein [Stenotrophomonas maltophilia]MCZ7842622.1 ATP-binding protein [Stenotrophomonas maltophilia]MDJ1626443.1 ATP-binding protein [Stenotrophomonas sepilia]OWQ75530.1 hybrid sensor histidine kinase/response regulator [Stenotrophomonas maltophilia]PZT37050.1 hybrid sensor histidine kinase/response regulator [Stenotrophomonas sepilia]
MNVAGRRAVAAVMASLLLPGIAAASGCASPLQVAWRSDRPPLSYSVQGDLAGLAADYLPLLGPQAVQHAQPLPAAVLTDDPLPAGTQVLLGWPRAQLPTGWVASSPYLEVPQVIVRREGAAPVLGLEGLRGRSVASPDRLPLDALLAEQAPGAQLLAPAPLDHALSLLRAGLVDAVVANLAEVEAALRAVPGDPLVIAAPAGFGDALVLAAVPACAAVVAAFDRELQREGDARRASVRSAWLPELPRARPAGSALRWLVPVSLILLALILLHAFGYWRVHRESVRRRVLEQRLHEVTANLPAVVYQARRSATGHYSLAQIAGDVQALFGVAVETEQIDHLQLLAAVHAGDRSRVMASIEAAALVRGPIDVTFRTRSAQGWRWVRSQGRPLPCDDSSVEWSGYWMDVSEAQARATALAEARRAAEQAALAKGHFLATMSHEIRTPMSTLLGMLERLAGTDLDAGQRQVLTTVGDAAQMLRQILDDVLHSQRLQPAPLQLRPTDLAALVRAVQQLLMPVAASRGLHLCSEIDPTLQPWSLADGLRLRQVLFNLAGNALKFTLQGSVVLQVRVLQQRDGGQRLRLQVTDTGVGISVERQQAVFAAYEQAEASTTRRFGGSGLGLSICRELATSMGGRLHLRSVPGKGTTVWLELDLAACAAPAAGPATARPAQRPLPPARVLVAEDHPTNLQLLAQRLCELGLQVHACSDGLQAWEAWQAQPFDLVITDCHMPHMDGFALARAIRSDACATRARVPIIALTASVLERTREACRDAGIDHFLAKPLEVHELRALLEVLLLPDSVRQ